MRPLRYSINLTPDGCCDHRAMVPDEDLHRYAVENLERADALLFGRGPSACWSLVSNCLLDRGAYEGPTLFAGLSKQVDLELVSRREFGSGAVAMRYVPRR